MRHFVQKAIQALPRLDQNQIRNLVDALAQESMDIELLEMVISSLPVGIIVARPDHCIQFLNLPVKRMIPLEKKITEETRVWDAILDSDIAAFVKTSLLEGDSVRPRDFTLDAPGRHRILAIGVMPVVKKGKIQGDFVYVEDVSETRQEEARLRRAESLASMTTMAASVAHEIKNPLGSIGIHLQLMQKILALGKENCRSELEEYIGIISEEVDRLNSIVVDYLFAVRPMDTSPLLLSLGPIIDELLSLVGPEVENEGIVLDVSIDQNLPPLLLDEKLIKQALLNIIKNAMAAMPDGGTLSIQTSLDDGGVKIQIKDTGTGIPEEILSKIFEPYFTTKSEGSGLGLTVVYKIVKEHGGELRVHSRKGKGSSFIIFLPVPQKDRKLLSWSGGMDEV